MCKTRKRTLLQRLFDGFTFLNKDFDGVSEKVERLVSTSGLDGNYWSTATATLANDTIILHYKPTSTYR